MSQDAYVFKVQSDRLYQFESLGSKGAILKAIQIYELPHYPNHFNVAFGNQRADGSLDEPGCTNKLNKTVFRKKASPGLACCVVIIFKSQDVYRILVFLCVIISFVV